MNTQSFHIPDFGALVISLDFELHWGVRDNATVDGPYRANLLGARTAVPRMLEVFAGFGIGVTWATVGFLFARSRQEWEEYLPAQRPQYDDPRLDPYRESPGEDEASDPFHYAPSLIDAIVETPRQELATHTFSHYYCQEAGQTIDTFREDLRSALRIAARYGRPLRSIVLPRNQYNPAYAGVLRECGITSFRGTERHWMYRSGAVAEQRTPWRRGARILDNYIPLSGANTVSWHSIPQPDGVCNVASSRFLRPWPRTLAALEPLRLGRMTGAMEEAARQRTIFHLNWHPHNFGVNLEENLKVLRTLLEHFLRLRDRYGMRSLSMGEVAGTLLGAAAPHPARSTA